MRQRNRALPPNPNFEIRSTKHVYMTKKRKTKQFDLEDRTFEFAKRVREFVKKLRKSVANIEDGKQLNRG